MSTHVERIVAVTRELAGRTSELTDFGPHVHTVYNPLQYARPMWEQYVQRFAPPAPARAVFLGMNPGPWGMAQTGIPFGEVDVVRRWLRLDAPVGSPPQTHPARPILGFECTRSEVSGRRLWGLMERQFGTPEGFFADQFVLNYCPLVFMAESGRNVTPNQLPVATRRELHAVCDDALREMLAILRPRFAVGVGAYAAEALQRALEGTSDAGKTRVVQILHPSPASPAANRGWEEKAIAQMDAAGVWRL